MKPHPRIRKTIKWGGAAVTVLLVVVWVGSGWYFAGIDHGVGRAIGVHAGCVYARWHSDGFDENGSSGPFCVKVNDGFNWVPRMVRISAFTSLEIPLWIPFLFVATVSATAWRLDTLARRRAKLNLCPKCGYDRTGISQDAKCPECGAVPASV